jgi:hypothetical protein
MIRTALLAGAVAIALCGAASAQAQERPPDYLFNVPVDVRDLPPQLTNLFVICALRTSGDGFAGGGITNVEITSGGFQGIVEVAVNRNPDVAGDPASWRCFLQLRGNINGADRDWTGEFSTTEVRLRGAQPPNLPRVLPSKAGTTPNVNVGGDFTP